MLSAESLQKIDREVPNILPIKAIRSDVSACHRSG
jgi:hypothetical protein